eukprot:Ihof_evm6s403 gene=Ihof_evmTU6s403
MVLTKVVLVSCGSFNPVTFMHLRMFELARDFLERTQRVEVIKGVISPVNDQYGKKGLVSAVHRLAMCRIAASTSDWIVIDDWEATQKEYQRTIDVLQKVTQDYNRGGVENIQVRLLCGADLLDSFRVPGVWRPDDMQRILQHGVVCVSRHGTDISKCIYESDILYQYQSNIVLLTEWISNNISSTKI